MSDLLPIDILRNALCNLDNALKTRSPVFVALAREQLANAIKALEEAEDEAR